LKNPITNTITRKTSKGLDVQKQFESVRQHKTKTLNSPVSQSTQKQITLGTRFVMQEYKSDQTQQ